ncbi:hypothetical protein ACERIT_03180 [Halopenitus sp. H-Gu1]|uniref:DUF7384 family protein n=1 Tax=Halopenitus sp. H-Gu1 TaxID=3242697 RepID=UPI00359D5BB7
MNWGTLFECGRSANVDRSMVRDALERRRSRDDDRRDRFDSGAASSELSTPDPTPSRVVADADVLAADLLCGGEAREALDVIRGHSWLTLIASEPLLEDAEWVIAELAGDELADAWGELIRDRSEQVRHPAGDHPALASAYRGGAMHVLSFDPRLTSAAAGAALRDRVPVSVREPRAFTSVFDAERLYQTVIGETYPGPDRDPRS